MEKNLLYITNREYSLAKPKRILSRIKALVIDSDCFPFIEFMLERIKETILEAKQVAKKNVGVSVGVNVGVKLSARDLDLLELLRIDNTLTALRIA